MDLIQRLTQGIETPDQGDVELNYRARLQLRVFLALLPATLLLGILLALIGGDASRGLYLIGIALLVEVSAFVLTIKGRIEIATRVIIYFLWFVLVMAIYFFDGLSGPTVMGQMLLIFTAGLLTGERMGIALAVMTILMNFGAALLQGEGQVFSIWGEMRAVGRWAVQSVYFLLTVVLTVTATRSIRRGIREAASGQIRMEKHLDELQAAQRALNRSETLYHGILEDQADIICRFRPDGSLTYANHAFFKFFEVEEADLKTTNYWDLIPEEVAETVKVKIRRLGPEDPVATSEAQVLRDKEGVHWQEWTDRGLFNEEGQLVEVQSLGRDVTEQVELKQRLEKSLEQMEDYAMTDALTNVMNRRAIKEELEAEWHRSTRENVPLSVALIDVDKLKDINDTHGHLAGDEALKQIASILRNGLRRYDRLGRWGGDEFIVVFPATGSQEAAIVAQRMRDLVNATGLELDSGTQVDLRISIGVAKEADFGHEDASTERVIARADEALYRAKELGRDRVEVAD